MGASRSAREGGAARPFIGEQVRSCAVQIYLVNWGLGRALNMNVIKFEILYIFGELLFVLRTTEVTAKSSIKRMNVTRHRRGKIVIYMSCVYTA